MKRKNVKEILLPLKKGVPLHPFVAMDDKIVTAIELMVKNNLRHMAVFRNGQPVGMVCLEHALQMLGLKPKGREAAL